MNPSDELKAAQHRVERLQAELDEAVAVRDAAMKACRKHGMTYEQIGHVAGLSRQRAQQVVTGAYG